MLRLIVKNFGVLKDIDIELHETNLFIGDNGSGKSTLAKLITIIADFTLDEDEILQRLKEFDINFLNEECFIQVLEDEKKLLEIDNTQIELFQREEKLEELEEKLEELEEELEEKVKELVELEEKLKELKEFKELVELEEKFKKFKKFKKLVKFIELKINLYTPKYIPSERNLISLFDKSLSNMISAEIPLPRALLEFSASYNSARNDIKELSLLGMQYKNENSQDRVYYEDGNYLTLSNSSSGIQSALPLYLTLKYFASKPGYIMVEEPEQNLYPKSQIETVKFMVENRGKSSLSIMTHSPYILSILNVLIFAHKASNTNDTLKEKISAIIPQAQQIDPDKFSAYLIEDGISKNIKGESTGMIQENTIDNIGDRLDDEFNELLDIYSEFEK